MSLVILKVDRENHTHSIYSDGISLIGGSEISDSESTKIRRIDIGENSILIGCTGVNILCRYVRLMIGLEIQKRDIIAFLSDDDEASERLSNLFQSLWLEFCKKHDIAKDDKDYSSFGCLLSINGHIFRTYCYQGNVFGTQKIIGQNYCAVGQYVIATHCLLENNIGIQKIYDTISKYNSYVNNNVKSIESVKYAEPESK